MSKNTNWEKIFYKSSASKEIQKWLKMKNGPTTFEITNEVFKEKAVNSSPVRMIPHYEYKTLPRILKENDLELFRHVSGGCVITKTGPNRKYPSIFPKLPICKKDNSLNLKPNIIKEPSLLLRSEINNEENGFFLFKRLKILRHYLENVLGYSVGKPLEPCGRLQSIVVGECKIGNNIVIIEETQFEIDHAVENDKYVVLIELKRGTKESQSLHQLVLPYIYLKSIGELREIILIHFEVNYVINDDKIQFKLWQLKKNITSNILDITKMYYEKGRKYAFRKT